MLVLSGWKAHARKAAIVTGVGIAALTTSLAGSVQAGHGGDHQPDPVEVRSIFASWYGQPSTNVFEGNWTAAGNIYTSWGSHMATPLFPGTTKPVIPFGTRVTVCTGGVPDVYTPNVFRCITATVDDTCPGCSQVYPKRWLDLSPGLFRRLDLLPKGLIRAVMIVGESPWGY